MVESARPSGIFSLILDSVRQPMIILLLAIAGLSLIFGKYLEATVMAVVVLAYVLVEFGNKLRTDRAMSKLKGLAMPIARVVRDGEIRDIPARELVVGDLLVLSPGVGIPADARIVEAGGLQLNEAALTGESGPVQKNPEATLPGDTPLPDRVNCVYASSTVFDGEGKAVVTAIGEGSEQGRIAAELRSPRKDTTVLQHMMTRLASLLAVLAITVSLLIPAIGLLRGLDLQQMILTWLALTFLMIPGQPPIIVQMSLALASFELAGKKVLVKRLRGAENMGMVAVILTDKTGTITENRMRLDLIIDSNGKALSPSDVPDDIKALIVRSLPQYPGDPTDLTIASAFPALSGKRQIPVSFQGFSQGRQRRVLSYKDNGGYLHLITGNPEQLIERSGLSPDKKAMLKHIVDQHANEGKRVTAFASFADESIEKVDLPGPLGFIALAVIVDPVRPGVKEAIRQLGKAGIRTIMVTGDHPATTKYVAAEVGLGEEIAIGLDMDRQSDEQLMEMLGYTHTFARITPLQKLRIVRTLHSKGQETAFIGDGINDAAAIKAAGTGIAMGETGTDLARENADLVLADDNYIHIADAVAIGRKALDNFRKGLTYYLTAKAILLSIFLVPLALGIPFPLAPIHIIIIELLMDLASSTVFVTEPAETDVMSRPPPKAKELLNISMAGRIFVNGLALTVGILTIYLWLYYTTGNVALAQTAAFVTWLPGHILLALNLKQDKTPLLQQGILSNRFGTAWLAGMIILTLAVTNVHALFPIVKTAALPVETWTIITVVAILTTCWIEAKKWLKTLG